ncbi:MAG: tryptophan synthase subunit beta [Bacteroidales bacterium]|nr:tryptophan synthase subunit beta [Bacteroidales bacterium]
MERADKLQNNQSNQYTRRDFQNGYFGEYGGIHVPGVLKEKLDHLASAFNEIRDKDHFVNELNAYYRDYIGRPSPLYLAKRLSNHVNSRIYLKREDLNHTGAHKINNTVGQILLAKHMRADEIIAETGAGQHGVATATAAALMGMKCKIFMGKKDAERQQMNVYRMKILGAELVTTERGTATLKDAINAALEYYVDHPEAFYLLGSAVGPHPYPSMVRYFQSVIGEEAKKQFLEKENKLPDAIFACVGGGSNAIGMFSGFLNDPEVNIYAAEGGGEGEVLYRTASTLVMGSPVVFQGTYSYCLVDEKHNPVDTYSIAAGLDYPGVGPEHSYLKDTGRAEYFTVTDQEAIEAFKILSALEGIIPAIESAHAVSLAMKMMKDQDAVSIVNLSGRGDKDMDRKLV